MITTRRRRDLSLWVYFFVLCWTTTTNVVDATDLLRSTVVLTRGRGPSRRLTNTGSSSACPYDPSQPTLVISHPASIDPRDRFYLLGGLSYQAMALVADEINNQRCGVTINGTRYQLQLRTWADQSHPDIHAAIGQHLLQQNQTHLYLGGYSSSLTQFFAPLTQERGKVFIAGGSSRTSVYRDRDLVFGILPPSRKYFEAAMEAVAQQGARTLAILQEDGTSACGPLPDVAQSYGLNVSRIVSLPSTPSLSLLQQVATNLSQVSPVENPTIDVVASCLRHVRCPQWIQAMRRVGWHPKAQIFGICGALELQQGPPADRTAAWYPDDAAHMMVAASWSPVLPSPPDSLTTWTPQQFATAFERTTGNPPAYQHAAAATALSVALQAAERAQSLDSRQIGNVLETQAFDTMYGRVAFDENGQNQAVPLLLQFDQELELHVVHQINGGFGSTDDTIREQVAAPNDNDNDNASPSTTELPPIVYPMPSWDERDCASRSLCGSTNGTCLANGQCACTRYLGSSTTTTTTDAPSGDKSRALVQVYNPFLTLSVGMGDTARCRAPPQEDFSYISDGVVTLGYTFMGIQWTLSLTCMVWTLLNHHLPLVMASQPFFLILVAVGGLILAAAILPLGQQGEYRHQRDLFTWEFSDIANPDINALDASCMAVRWFMGLGFALIFAALFAKVWRIRMIYVHARSCRRQKVQIKDVLYIVMIMVALETTVLLVWQLVSPLQWEREATRWDEDGFAIQSVGKCASDTSFEFYVIWGCVNGLCLLYALWLCYLTRHVSEDFSNGKWITISIAFIFQVILLAVPVLSIAEDDREAAYILNVMVVFTVSASVTLFIFAPLMWRIYHGNGDDVQPLHSFRRGPTSAQSLRKLQQSPRGSLREEQAQGRGDSPKYLPPDGADDDLDEAEKFSFGMSASSKKSHESSSPVRWQQRDTGDRKSERRSSRQHSMAVIKEDEVGSEGGRNDKNANQFLDETGPDGSLQ